MNKIAMYEELLETHPLWTKEALDATDVKYFGQRQVNRAKNAVKRLKNTRLAAKKDTMDLGKLRGDRMVEIWKDSGTGEMRANLSDGSEMLKRRLMKRQNDLGIGPKQVMSAHPAEGYPFANYMPNAATAWEGDKMVTGPRARAQGLSRWQRMKPERGERFFNALD